MNWDFKMLQITLIRDGVMNSRSIHYGVLRNNMTQLSAGFSKSIGVCNARVAECWGLLEGIKLIRSKGFQKVEI